MQVQSPRSTSVTSELLEPCDTQSGGGAEMDPRGWSAADRTREGRRQRAAVKSVKVKSDVSEDRQNICSLLAPLLNECSQFGVK